MIACINIILKFFLGAWLDILIKILTLIVLHVIINVLLVLIRVLIVKVAEDLIDNHGLLLINYARKLLYINKIL